MSHVLPRLAGAAMLGLATVPAAQGQALVHPLPQSPSSNPLLDTRAWPLSAVGKLNVVTGPGSRQHCTATLIGRRHALTAAHCLWDRARQRWVDPASVHFVVGYAQGTYTAHSIARGYTKPDAYQFGTSREALARDWAVVALAEPIALKPIGLGPTPDPEAAGTTYTGILHAGYKSFSDQIVSAETGCRARYVPSALPLLDHFCSVVSGESGSALILTGDAEPAVIGIVVASALVGSPPSLAVPTQSFRDAVEKALVEEASEAAPAAQAQQGERRERKRR